MIIGNLIYIAIIIIFISIQGFLANSEMAMVSCNRFRMQYLAKNNKKASIILFLLNIHIDYLGQLFWGLI